MRLDIEWEKRQHQRGYNEEDNNKATSQFTQCMDVAMAGRGEVGRKKGAEIKVIYPSHPRDGAVIATVSIPLL